VARLISNCTLTGRLPHQPLTPTAVLSYQSRRQRFYISLSSFNGFKINSNFDLLLSKLSSLKINKFESMLQIRISLLVKYCCFFSNNSLLLLLGLKLGARQTMPEGPFQTTLTLGYSFIASAFEKP